MGASESKHSSRSDVLPNLQYALNELMLWRERGIEEKCSEEKGRKGVFGQFGKFSAPLGDSSASSSNIGSSSGASGMMASKPTSDTASESSGVSGSESLSSGIASGVSSMASVVGSSASSALSSLRQPSPQQPQSQEDVGTVAPLLQQGDVASMAAADRADGEVIHDKYHFILHHIQKLVTAAEENYMMLCKENWIKNQTSKINLAQAMGPTTRAELERKLSENSTEFMKQLGDYDNARMAIQWLQRHFDLLVQRRSLGREITHINMRIANIQKQPPSEDTLDELRHLRGRLQQAHVGVSNAVTKAQQLRRESLAVGLQYLDINHSGGIEPSDQPEISAEMFSRLDVRNKHRVTANDLQMAVHNMEKNIDTLSKEIFNHEREVIRLTEEREKVLSGVPGEVETDKRRVQAEELSVEKKKKEDTIRQSQGEKAREEAILRDTYSMFQKAFVDSLFNKLGDAHADKSRYEALGGEMENIERNMKNLHIAADRGKQELAQSKLSASPGMSRKSPLFGRRRMPSSAAAATSDVPSSSFGSLLSRNKSGTSGSVTSDVIRGKDTGTITTGDSSSSSSISDTSSGGSGMTGFTRVTDNTKMGSDTAGSRSSTNSPDRDTTTNINMEKNKDTNIASDDTTAATTGSTINEQQQQQQQSSMKGKPQQSQLPQGMRQQQRTNSGGTGSGDDSAI